MRTASPVLCLAICPLLSLAYSHNAATRSRPSSPNVCAIEPNAIVSDACASYDTLDAINGALAPSIKDLTQTTDFFAYYRLNLFNQVCPFWSDAGSLCGNIACAVNTLDDEKDIPPVWRLKELSKLQGPKAEHPDRKEQKERGDKRPLQGDLGENVGESCVVEYDDECDDRNYCIPEDEQSAAKGNYVSLVDNPERYTGYKGESAHMVWDAIYKENCFSKPKPAAEGSSGTLSAPAANELLFVLKANAPAEAFTPDDTCVEKRVFYRIISGMHASISAHICHDYLNQTTGTWGPNLTCYQQRLDNHPDRISNLYFNYALVLRAVAKLRSQLHTYTFCEYDPVQDSSTRTKLLRLADAAATGPTIFDETIMFQDPYFAMDMKEDFRNRFRNVSRLMDCVGCDKCRLWGKLQTAGYGTALKVLFEFSDTDPVPLKHTELVALVNTLARISSSLGALEDFRAMLGQQPSPAVQAAKAAARTPASDVAPTVAASSAAPAVPADWADEYDEPDGPGVADVIGDEIRLVLRAFRYVLKSWIGFPRLVGTMLLFEATRAWAFWLGLEVPARRYEWTLPTRADL